MGDAMPFQLPPKDKWVVPAAAKWGNSEYLPRVPSLPEILAATKKAGIVEPFPPEQSELEKAEVEELIELSQLRDDPNAVYSGEPGRERRKVSWFLNLRPQPLGAVYNRTTPDSAPVIRTGRELARWFEAETPGLGERHALNHLLPLYGLSPPHQARIWAALDCAIYGAFLGAWHFKWEESSTKFRRRPYEASAAVSVLYNHRVKPDGSGDGELRREPAPSPGTPRHPAYPAGHSTVAGAGCAILSHFFPDFTSDFDDLADNQGMARLWAGIHFRSDHTFGLALGNVIASIVIARLKQDGVNA
jgi:hypothetical protein